MVLFQRDGQSTIVSNEQHIVRITEGTKISIDIQVFDEHHNKSNLSLPSVVEEIGGDGFLFVQAVTYRGVIYPLPHDELFSVYFMAEIPNHKIYDMFMFPASFVTWVEREHFVYAKLKPMGEIERAQRRNCYRLPVSTPVFAQRMPENSMFMDTEIGDRLVVIEEFSRSIKEIRGSENFEHNARTVNFSDGGMLLSIDEEFERSEKVILNFRPGKPEVVAGVVLRVAPTENGRDRFRIAVKFENADEAQKERFYRFIMETQRKMMRQHKI